jgi:hypothetical protein
MKEESGSLDVLGIKPVADSINTVTEATTNKTTNKTPTFKNCA